MTDDAHHPQPNDEDTHDDAVLDELHGLVADVLSATDSVPAHVVDLAKAAFAWRTIDAELDALVHAELVFDSALDSAGVRDDHHGAARQLTFAADDVEIEVMIDQGRRLIGQLVPPVAATVHLESTADVSDSADGRQTEVDTTGSFVFTDAPTGPVRLRVVPDEAFADTDSVVTSWTVL